MTGFRERPSDAEVAAWVSSVRGPVLAHTAARRWWKVKRSLVVGSVVGAVAVGGLAYATSEHTRTPEPPATVQGDSVIEIGRPALGDKWLNLSISYRCKPGEGFDLRDDGRRLAWADCDLQSFPDEDDPTKLIPGPGGIQKSVPVEEVRGTKLILESTLTDAAIVKAEFGSTSAMSRPEAVPPNGPDGEPDWVIPTYPVNEYGLTVGQILMDVPESAFPDLIPFELDGREVYVLKRTFIIELPARPGEFSMEQIDRHRGIRRDGRGREQFKAYKADGKTLAGWVEPELQRVRCSAC